MWKTARDQVCLICRSARTTSTTTASARASIESWTSQRTFATRREQRPSRMVLSDRVARPPPVRAPGEGPKKPRNRPEGPWAGTNRRVANIDPRKAPKPKPVEEDDRRGGKDKKTKGQKALKMQRALATISYGQRTSIKERMQEIQSFDQFNLLPVVKEAVAQEALKGMTEIKPTPVQRLAIPALLGQPMGKKPRRPKSDNGREEFLLAAETGSGKTLAYLVPAVNAIKKGDAEDELVAAYNERLAAEKERRGGAPVSEWIEKFEPHPNTARPRVVVLVPTAELVDQVTAVAKKLAHYTKFKVRPLSATLSPLKNQRNLYSPIGVDMIIATPHLLATIAKSDPNVLSRVSHLVIDEADSLLDRSFSGDTTSIVDRAMPSLKQLILCSATIPRRLDTYMEEQFPYINRITTPNLHAIPRRVQLGVIDVSKDPYRNNKMLACADAIWSIGKEAAKHEAGQSKDEIDVKRIMVFVNERETTQQVADYLVSKGIDAIALHRDTEEHRKSEMLASFTSNEPMKIAKPAEDTEGGKAGAVATRRHLPNTKVIVATDLASRGIDTLAVRFVVLYDVPHTTIDFIHRLGRAGRMNRRGRGIVLVGKDDRRDVVAEVKESMYMGQALV
ncbi:ATP-dependent RNA helicase mrh-4, mitochondrial [Sordaria brevicollis]|uniref:RNA helicase n=1 Tax=Sordaria brevicollis TaxID=83679 RepID=A0AAE0PJV0_SORBR|nr:ATP-dependent RNA helicase mrh-4, mitochondrial [Sordaria brevicollis]